MTETRAGVVAELLDIAPEIEEADLSDSELRAELESAG